jgi:hypothetical protein
MPPGFLPPKFRNSTNLPYNMGDFLTDSTCTYPPKVFRKVSFTPVGIDYNFYYSWMGTR